MDPAEALNQKVLQDRERRIIEQETASSIDLGLSLQEQPAGSAAEFLADEWDKKVFGAPPKLTTRVVYGPDPLVNNCPEFHERLERYGQEEVAGAFRSLILEKGPEALPDPIMRKGVRGAIDRFGKEATAQAFYDRIMRIPARTVEIEVDTELDPLLVNPMRDLVARYCQPGQSPKFLSERCISVLGRRGYEIVKDERGDPVKCGTLIMGVIPTDWAERRRRHFAEESSAMVADQEAAFYEKAEQTIRDSGSGGLAPLARGESVRPNARGGDEDPDQWLGQQREAGITFERP